MMYRVIHDDGVARTFAVVLERDEEVVECLLAFAQEQDIVSARLTAIGAFSEVTFGYFELEKKDYKRIHLVEQVEAASLIGNMAVYEGRLKLHAHLVVGRSDGSAMAGHLMEAIVQPTLEIMLTTMPVPLERFKDEATGIGLLKL